jgi:hypothetical protein
MLVRKPSFAACGNLRSMKLPQLALTLALVTAWVPSIAGGTKPSAQQQAVIVHFEYGMPDWNPFLQFEKVLEFKINTSGAGDYDGNELAADGSDGILYMYGPDADKLFAAAKPVLLSTTLLKNVTVTLRYGDVKDKSARVVTVRLGY